MVWWLWRVVAEERAVDFVEGKGKGNNILLHGKKSGF
ncbi:predicted protein [Sclerotinia sclerotiorum 1980 UF-70]|uniref:Uncharacterized protein n=1 Tax=Sclerotinia sclerotiorum (strain ATCC 18683 / 1980 / Ss-1) TaxID=665079 RepID=A7ES94_SCLS1|nr:predicted protein [Sclerotinia sclerotiorum 1980 UF-70]EDN92336.1 predicted protein [Sclerotinia sclerotiorum 1980 UF-70]